MAEPEWTVLAEAGRVRLLEFSSNAGEPPRVVQVLADPEGMPRPGEPSDESMQRFARAVVDVLEKAYAQARFEFLRIAVEPRFEGPLRAEIERRLDLPRAVLEWRALKLIPPEAAAAPQAAALEQVPQDPGTPPSRE
ncbi:host attachment protein [Variovorax sp. OV329]|uniref:host attachment protein n=1 Tax=Variovorax sp. OV329 TaxID=1882825 RepID=UPI001587B1B6|nr:host attachment protein [Variovorax sp. OV329]